MRHRGRAGPPRVAIAVAAGVLLLLLGAGAALALDPTASPAGGGDVRSNPPAPGLVGDPLFAVLGVAVVGLAAVAFTLIAVRLADRRPR